MSESTDLEAGEPLRDGYLEAVSAPVWPPAAANTEGPGLRKAAQRALECLDRFSYFRDSGVKGVADSLRKALAARPVEGEKK